MGKQRRTFTNEFKAKMGQSLFLWDWKKLSQSIENQEHLGI